MSFIQSPTVEPLSKLTQYTKNRVLVVELCNQFCLAILGFAAFIAIKSLGASKEEAVVLTNGAQATFLLAFFFSTIMSGRSKSRFLIMAAVFTRLSMCACAFVTTSLPFTCILCAAFLGAPIYVPAINALGQRNYRKRHRGRVNGSIVLWSLLVFIVATLMAGTCLEKDPDAFHWLFPLAGVIGFFAYAYAARIRFRRPAGLQQTKKISRTLHDLCEILNRNRAFLKFQIGFFLYGIGFMICMPTNILVLTKDLDFTYQEFAIGITICGTLCTALCSPFSGRIFDWLGPSKSCSIFFLILALHPLCMLLAYSYDSSALAYLAYVIFGLGLAGVNQSWFNGPMHYAKNEDSSLYMGIHMSNVGLRAIIGSVVVIIGNQSSGGSGAQLIAHTHIYLAAIVLFIASALWMLCLKTEPAD